MAHACGQIVIAVILSKSNEAAAVGQLMQCRVDWVFHSKLIFEAMALELLLERVGI